MTDNPWKGRPMWPDPAWHLDVLRASGVTYGLCDDWDHRNLSPYASSEVDLRGGLLHHTANGGAKGDAPALGYCLRGTYPPVRNCNFLVSRSGVVHVLTVWPCYHAGAGRRWDGGPSIPDDQGNKFLLGVEIESRGTTLDPRAHDGTDGYTQAQQDATAALAAAYCDAMGWEANRWVNHRTWAPDRKTDTLVDDERWAVLIAARMGGAVAVSDDDVERIAEAVWRRIVVVDGAERKMGAMLVSTYRSTRSITGPKDTPDGPA